MTKTEYHRQYYQRHCESRKSAYRVYYRQHRQDILNRNKMYYAQNRERILEELRAHRLETKLAQSTRRAELISKLSGASFADLVRAYGS